MGKRFDLVLGLIFQSLRGDSLCTFAVVVYDVTSYEGPIVSGFDICLIFQDVLVTLVREQGLVGVHGLWWVRIYV